MTIGEKSIMGTGLKTVFFLLLLSLSPNFLSAQPVTVTVTNTNGDSSAGSFGGAITSLNGTAGGGAISFVVSSAITLTQPLPAASKNITLIGNNATVKNTGSNDIQILSSADFSESSGITLFVTGAQAAAGTTSGPGTIGGPGNAAGNVAVTALSSTLDVSTGWVINSGHGGPGGTGGTGANGGNGATGGNVAVTLGVLTMNANSLFDAMGGLGGGGGAGGTGGAAGNGGAGGGALVSIGSLTTASGSNFSLYGGPGNGGTVSGTGGSVALQIGAVTMNGGNFLLQGGGGGSGTAGANGGNVAVTFSSINMNSNATLLINGGSPGNPGGTGGNASVTAGSVSLGSNASFTMGGGTGGNAGATIQSLTMVSSSSFVLNGAASTAAVSVLNGSGFVSVGNLRVQNGTYYGTIDGTLTVPLSAIFTLDGTANIANTNTANIAGGTLVLGDSLPVSAVLNGSVTISNGSGAGVLAGYGRVNGTVTNSGSVLPYGASVSILGSLTFTQYNQTANGALNISVFSGNQSDSLVVSGANLGGTLTTTSYGGQNYGFRDRYQILSGTNINGTFSQVFTAVSGMSPYVLYNSNAVTLVLLHSGVDYTAYAKTPNETAVAAALNASLLTCSDALIAKDSELYYLPSGQAAVLDQMSGVIYTSLPNVLLDNLQFENDLLFSRMDGEGSVEVKSPQAFLMKDILASDVAGNAGRAAGSASPGASGLWLQNTDSFGSVNATDNVLGFNKSNFGFLGGYDTELSPGLTAGLMGGTLHCDLTQSDGTAKAGIDGIQFGLYGNRRMGVVDVSAVAGYVLNHFKVNRTITLGSDVNQLAGAYDGSQIAGALQVGARLTDVDTTFKPFAGLQYAHLSENAFTESGSDSLELSIPAQSYDSLRPYAGLGETWTLGLGKDTQLVPGVRVSVSQELMNTSSQITTAFGGAPGNSFTVAGITPASTEFTLGGGLEFLAGKQFTLFADYNGHFSGSQNLNTFNGGVNLSF